MVNSILEKIVKRKEKKQEFDTLIDELVETIIPDNKNLSMWEQGAQNLLRAFSLALLHNKEEKALTLERLQDFCGLGYLENDRLELMKTYFKSHNLEIRKWADAVLSSSNDSARRYLSIFYTHLARAKE